MQWLVALGLTASAMAADLDAPPTGSPGLSCEIVEVVATGRPGHSANPNPDSAPHLLIRGLDRLSRWARSSAHDLEIVAFEAAASINSVPARAAATIELRHPAEESVSAGAEMRRALGPELDLERPGTACEPRE